MPARAMAASSLDFTPLTPTAPMHWPSTRMGTRLQHALHGRRRQEGHAALVDDVLEGLGPRRPMAAE